MYNPYDNVQGIGVDQLKEMYSPITAPVNIPSQLSNTQADVAAPSSSFGSNAVMPALGFGTSLFSTFGDTTVDNAEFGAIDKDNPFLDGRVYNRNINANSDERAVAEGNANIVNSTASGAAAGTAILPGIGTLVGGGIGALTGFIGKGSKRRKARRKRREAEKKYRQQIGNYNSSVAEKEIMDATRERNMKSMYGGPSMYRQMSLI